MHTLTVALDWTPNTNHTGFFVAKAKRFYAEQGLLIDLRSPETDNYAATPAKLVAENKAHFAIAPSDTVISYQTLPEKPNLTAIAAILQEDTSAIVSLTSSGISRIKDLEGKKYASYDARFEDTIVSEMIKKDGGKGEHIKITPDKLGIWNTLLQGEADATWVFMPWEGIMAKRKGIGLNVFKLKDYDIPYGYSPVLLAHPQFLKKNAETTKKFLAATAKGYEWAHQNPNEAAKILADSSDHPDLKDLAFLEESQTYIAQYYVSRENRWGMMEDNRWVSFIHWLQKNKLISKSEENLLERQNLYTNKYLS